MTRDGRFAYNGTGSTMLVVISDLHFQHVSLDSIRYVQDGLLRETGVRRNVTRGALALLLADVCRFAERGGSKLVEIVFNGDIFELWRSPLWFSSGDVELRPYGNELGPDDVSNPLRNKTLEILEAVAQDNREVWETLARFVAHGAFDRHGQHARLPEDCRVAVHYLPGNHDRLANAWPSVRRRVRELLSMAPSEAPFEHVIDRDFRDGYGVRIRHGHEYDPANIGVEVPYARPVAIDEQGYLAPCLGDYVTIDGVARLGTSFRALYASRLRQDSEDGQRLRRFYNALIEFDDVRPPTLLIQYLIKRLGGTRQDIFELLRPVLVDLYVTAARDPFVQRIANRLAMLKYLTDPVATLVRESLRALSPESLERLLLKVQAMDSSNSSLRGAAMASFEDALTEGRVDVVIAGHTHHPDQVPMPSPTESDAFFIDVGTWRSTIRHGVSGVFGRLRSYTAAFVYSDSERRFAGDGRRFETWTGNLAASDFGPYDTIIGAPSEPAQELWITAVTAVRVDEGSTRDGAELRIEVGVDDEARVIELDAVHDAETRVIEGVCIPLRREMHGELWGFGSELDQGRDSLLDSDDPLPWALRYLPRGRDGAFLEGPGSFALADRSGTDVRITYLLRGRPAVRS